MKVCIHSSYLKLEFMAWLMNILVGTEGEFDLNVILLKRTVSSKNVGLHVWKVLLTYFYIKKKKKVNLYIGDYKGHTVQPSRMNFCWGNIHFLQSCSALIQKELPWSRLREVYICVTDMKWQMSKCSWTAEVCCVLFLLWRRGHFFPTVFGLSATTLLHLREGSAVLPNHARN